MLALKTLLAHCKAIHSVVHNIKIHLYQILMLNVHLIFIFHVYHNNHIIFKIKKNVWKHSSLIIIIFKITLIISKYNVHNPNCIILIYINHINVLNNVQMILILHIMHFNITVLTNALYTYYKTKLNIV